MTNEERRPRADKPDNPYSADYTQPLTDFEKRAGVVPIIRAERPRA